MQSAYCCRRLDGNPLRCDCDLKPTVSFFQSNPAQLLRSSETTCAAPTDLFGRGILTLDSASLCSKSSTKRLFSFEALHTNPK